MVRRQNSQILKKADEDLQPKLDETINSNFLRKVEKIRFGYSNEKDEKAFMQRKNSVIPIKAAKVDIYRPEFFEKKRNSRTLKPVKANSAALKKLSFLEVKGLSEEFLVPIKSIYELASAFNGLKTIAKDNVSQSSINRKGSPF